MRRRGCRSVATAKGRRGGPGPPGILYPSRAEVRGGGEHAGDSTAGHRGPVATLACYDWVRAGRNAEESIVADAVSTSIEENIRAAFAEAEKETAFWREHYDTYLTQYPDQFVAVSRADGRVVVASANLDYLLGFLAGRGLDVQQVWLKFIAATPQHVTL